MTAETLHADAEARSRAIEPGTSCIVQAPAGSGKTSLLTLRFLRLLAQVDCPEQIVAITFTRKAASEMRHRIVRALSGAATGEPVNEAPQERETRCLAAAALARSRERGWGLESNPARLHIQTIDGLNHWLARRLPLAARIGLAAALVDDAKPLYAEAARRFVSGLDGDGPTAAPIERLARALDHDPGQLVRLVTDMLGAREVWLPKLLATPPGPALRAEIDRLLESALECELAAIAAELADVLPEELLAVIREAAARGAAGGPLAALAGIRALPPALASALPQWHALADLLLKKEKRGVLRRTVVAAQGFLPAAEGAPWPALKERMVGCLAVLAQDESFAQTLVRVRGLPPPSLTDAQWERIDALCAVLPHAAAELLAVFAERGSLDHAAVAAAARDALGEESAPSELALALDYRIQHLLVDEYQDTSPAQQRLLELLVAGWQSGDGRTLFCVGDPMQSIYAFREADVTLFLQAQREGIGGVALAALRLARNFRSAPAIVDWVNRAFATLLPERDDFERGAVRYSPAAAAAAGGAPGAVRVHALLDADERAMGEVVAGIAAELLGRSGDRPTIAVLVRARASLPPVLAALRAAGIEYRGVELEPLAQRPAIRDLVALGKALLHRGDRTAWLAILRAPWCGLSLADLHALAHGDAEAPVAALAREAEVAARLSAEGRRRLGRTMSAMDAAVTGRARRTLGGWLKSAWLALGGPATVADASDLENAELLFAALDTLEREAGGWPAATAIDAAVAGIMASPVGNDAAPVQLMTIHRAKGLEFDAVIVPDLQRGAPRGDRPLLYWTQVATSPARRGIVLASRGESGAEGEGGDPLERWMRRLQREREALELGRVAYVAATRARRELHLVGSARLQQAEEGPVVQAPPAGSLLGFLWPVVRADFERARAESPAGGRGATSSAGRRRLGAPPLARLPSAFVPPAPVPPPRVPPLRIVGEPQGSVRPDFDWAGAIAQAVGQVVHQELHRLARLALPGTALQPRTHAWRRALAGIGIDEAHMAAALERVRRAIAGLSRSETARRLLDPASAEAASELALTALVDGAIHGLRIDRTFVDGDGVRWIVDWKTSSHEGGDREAFLDNELDRYRPQLERYARVMAKLDPRPQRVGLYFPLLDAWRELTPQAR